MKKRWIMFTMLAMLLCVSACTNKEDNTLKGNYEIYIGNYDWGCSTASVIISFDHPLDAVTPQDFNVMETKKAADMSKAPEFPITDIEVARTVTNAYLSDDKGKAVSEPSKYVTLELQVGPNEGSPLLYDFVTQLNTWSDPYYLTITKADTAELTSQGNKMEKIQIDTAFTAKKTAADAYKIDEFKASDGVNYAYASYEPEEESDTLFVWLHGLGEGGTENTDPYITALGNKATAFLSEEFQETVGNAHVLMPQCPTYWMDADGQKSNFIDGIIHAGNTSYYENSLMELINTHKEKVGAKKVVLAGCSNGGYMTLLLGLHHPEAFDAIIPICEALPDQAITDEEIQAIKDVPMFFVYSLDDPIVDPAQHELPTIERLRKANASNLHVSEFEHVIDTSGEYKDEQGNPYQYVGHFSWIYFENNESLCNECKIAPWQWIAEQLQNIR